MKETAKKLFAIAIVTLCSFVSNALPLVWRADWPDAKPVETLVHRGTDIELQPLWRINKEPADTNGWTFTTFCQTNAVGPWFGPLPGAFFSHTNDVGAAFYNVMVRAQTPGGAVNYTAFARLRMLDSPGFTPGELPLPAKSIDFAEVEVKNAPWAEVAAIHSATNTVVLTNGTLRTLGGKEIKPTDVGAAAAEDLEPLSQDIARAYQYSRTITLYMTGNTNAWFAGTNYVFGADAATRTHFWWEDGMDAATVPCSMALWEIRDGVKQCVWDQRDWPAWYWSFKAKQMKAEINASNALFRAEVNAAINSDEAHAWAKRYASTGRKNPDASTTFIDTPSVTLSPGMSWETVATVGGCGYWTIVGNGAVIGGSGTNATLNIKDFDGNSILEITKGQHMLAWLDKNDFVGLLTDSDGWICFDMRADVKPTGYFSTTLVATDFVAETDENCPAQYYWEDLGGHVWRVHYLLKPGIVSDACFAKFQVEIGGKTQIRYNADTVINGGLIFNGVKIAPVIQSGASVGSTVTWKVVE